MALGVQVEVAVLGADGAVAGFEGDVLEAGREDLVADGATVAVGFVPDLRGRGGGGRHVGVRMRRNGLPGEWKKRYLYL